MFYVPNEFVYVTFDDFVLIFNFINFCLFSTDRKPCPPLDLTNLPGTDRLTLAEKEVRFQFFGEVAFSKMYNISNNDLVFILNVEKNFFGFLVQLCSSIRLLPNAYLHHRSILQRESFYQNGLKLQTARALLKIDVNKTKRLFEFCVEQGYIQYQRKSEENNNENENVPA